MRELAEVHLADSFYQQVHKLGSGKVSIVAEDSHLEIPIPEPSADGNRITLLPAHYSFDRAQSAVDYGQLKFRGVRVASPTWQHEVPVGGVDMRYLHDYVERAFD